MTTKVRIPTAISIASSLVALGSALPALASDQSAFFWKELQKTDGVSLPQTVVPMNANAFDGEDKFAVAEPDWFATERQKTEGYRDERAMASESVARREGEREEAQRRAAK